MNPWKIIRKRCLYCAGTYKEVEQCSSPGCPLWPYRFGYDPNKKPRQISEEQREALRTRMRRIANVGKNSPVTY